LLTAGNTFTGGVQQINGAASSKALIIRANATTPGNLIELQNSAGTAIARIQSDGAFVSDFITGVTYVTSTGKMRTGGTTNYGAQMEVTATVATNIGQIIRGATSQSASLQEWQDSAGTVIGAVRSAGQICSGPIITGCQASITPFVNTVTGLIIRGATSQSNDLQQWQNTGGAVLAKVAASGNIVAGNMAIATSSVSTIHISNGTIPSANPVGGGVLYVESGALKYRGSSGTITTLGAA
jgi:hypothetical protein